MRAFGSGLRWVLPAASLAASAALHGAWSPVHDRYYTGAWLLAGAVMAMAGWWLLAGAASVMLLAARER